jgi:hypothetical protein
MVSSGPEVNEKECASVMTLASVVEKYPCFWRGSFQDSRPLTGFAMIHRQNFQTRLCRSGLTKPQDIPDAILWLLMNA